MDVDKPTSDSIQDENTYVEGTVIRSTGSWYEVMVGERVFPSKVRGKFRLSGEDVTNPVAVGDHVTIRLAQDETGLITEIHPRKNRLSRRAAGRKVGQEHIIAVNVDKAWLIQSVRQPKINPGLIDRFLVIAGSFEIPAGIVFNKMDLMKPADRDAVEYLHDMYASIGYEVLPVSALTGDGIDVFRDGLAGRTSVLSGPSGVGKSTLLNVIEPDLALRTGEVSGKTQKGRHTTTSVTLHPLMGGGYVIDTPGIREFGIVDLEPDELDYYFVEFRPYLSECRYPNCSHDHEPECAVMAAVEAGSINDERYYSYLNILESLRMGEKDVGR